MRRPAVVALAVVAMACTGCATGQTGAPLDVSTDNARVTGNVISDAGGQVEYWAEYGPTTAYGSQSGHATTSVAPNALTGVTVSVGGLTRSTLYHYRLCAQDGSQRGGPGCGGDRTVRTQAVACGDTVTTDVRLTGDLQCFTGPGLTIGADGVDINLAGHAIAGTIASGGGGPAGVANAGGFDDVTVHNGRIGGLGAMFTATNASRNRLVRVDGTAAGTAISFDGGADNEVRHADLFGRSQAVSVRGSQRFVLADSQLDGFFSGGLTLTGADARILRNRFPRAAGAFPVTSALALTGERATISDNVVTGAWSAGGILATGPGHRLIDNEVSGATKPDVSPPNDVFGDGIVIGSFSAGVLVRGNRAHDNEGDGIVVGASDVRIGDNSANDNGGFGIDAVAGVTDLGGNTASGNGNPLQCRNVFCP
jgi:parallel beta-helix repeat protein